MILTDLLQKPVQDHSGHRLGTVIDARFEVDIDTHGHPGTARLVGLIVSRHTGASFRGYERSGVEAPWPIAQIFERQHRGSFLVLWEDIEVLGTTSIRLRTGFKRHSSQLKEQLSASG
jgi:sporulation protein YlmC with PRC-barrel domain